MLANKKNEPAVSDRAPVRVLRERRKSCGVCGAHFVPRTALSTFCDFCSTPSSSFLAIREVHRAQGILIDEQDVLLAKVA